MDFAPETQEERRLMALGDLLHSRETLIYPLVREILNVKDDAMRKLCREQKLERIHERGQWLVTTASVRDWLETGRARNVFKGQKIRRY